jgi:uncharacterized protein YuzE
MKYWLTTHWPPRKGYAHAVGAFSDDDPYVWLPDGREAAGAGLARDDLVLVYESRSRRQPGVILDYDGQEDLVGLEVLNASKRVANPRSVEYAITK